MQLIINIENESRKKDIEMLRLLLKRLNIPFSESKTENTNTLNWFIGCMPDLDVHSLNEQLIKSRDEWGRINI